MRSAFTLTPVRQLGCVALLAATVALLYGHTLHVPMYLDDHGALLENYRLRDLSATFRHMVGPRGLTNLTFALNFRMTGWSLPPLHLTNILLHILCGVLVWRLLGQLIAGWRLPLTGALLFVAHPLQTQAVTYLVQRSAVLAGCFFVAAVLCHRHARGCLATGADRSSRGYIAWYAAAVICGSCAVLAKESAATLPLLLILHDRLFPLPVRRDWQHWLFDYLPYCVMPLVLGGPLLVSLAMGGSIPRTASALVSAGHNDPMHYLVTEFSVFWVYLRLLLFPYGQALEHDYKVVEQLLTVQNLLSLAGLIVVVWLAWRVRRRRPLLTFGIAWVFLTLAVESSVIPLDPLFEHRLYLPMFGFVLILLDGLSAMLGERRAPGLVLVAILVCLPLTWQRNALWREPLLFNEHDLGVSPDSERVRLALIYNYRDAGRLTEAELCIRELLRINPRSELAYEELILLYAGRGEFDRALSTLQEAITLLSGEQGLYKVGARVYLQRGEAAAAIQILQRGVDTNPLHAGMLAQLAALHFELGDLKAAESVYRQSLLLKGNSAAARRSFAKVLFSQGEMGAAMEQLRLALQLEPGNPDTLEGYGKAALSSGRLDEALWAAKSLQYNEPTVSRELYAAISEAAAAGR